MLNMDNNGQHAPIQINVGKSYLFDINSTFLYRDGTQNYFLVGYGWIEVHEINFCVVN